MRILRYFVFLGILPLNNFSQTPTIEIVDDLGANTILIDCDYPVDINRCFDLNANYTSINATTSYAVNAITFQNLSGLTNETLVSIASDDKWSDVLQLPFEFCFFDEIKTDFIISDNGVISFNTNLALTDSPYSPGTLPNASMPTDAIYGAFHDLTNDNNVFGCTDNPSTGINECGEIKTYVVGTAPQRSFVISYEGINHFNCDNVRSTFQIVLYEGSNIIETYIEDKPINCELNPTHFRKNALVGIQNQNGTISNTPIGRNSGVWSTNNEAWQFLPDGATITSVRWEDALGTTIGSGDQINVCPQQTTTYTAIASYLQCDGSVIEVNDTINITISVDFPIAIDNTITICDVATIGEELVDITSYDSLMLGTQTGLILSYFNTLPNAQNDTNPIINPTNYLVTNPTEIIYVRMLRGIDCYDVGLLTFTITQAAISQISEITLCDLLNDNSEMVSFSNYTAQILGAQTGFDVSYHLTQADADANTNPQTQFTANDGDSYFVHFSIPPNQDCPSTEEITVRLIETPVVEAIPVDICSNILNYDLTQHEATIQGNNTEILSFSYYTSQIAAMNANNPIDIADISNFILNGAPSIWVRTEIANGCFKVHPINFNYINGVAAINDTQISLSHLFNLTDSLVDMVTDLTDITVQYFDESGVLILDPVNYVTINDTEIITVVFTNTSSGCITNATILLVTVDFNGVTDTNYPICDANSDNTELVILANFDTLLITGLDDNQYMTVAYFMSNADAVANTNEIIDITITGVTTIYARISLNNEDDVELDFMVETITLSFQTTAPLMSFTTTICDDLNDNQEDYNLTDHEAIIGGGTAGLIFTYNEANGSLIADPVNYVVYGPNRIITVYVEALNGCISNTTLTISFYNIENNTTTLEQCDYDNNNQETFDLATSLPNINTNHSNYTISYYLTQIEADAGLPATEIPNPNALTINTNTTIYVRLHDNTINCYTTATLNLSIITLPYFATNTINTLCDYENDGIENNVTLAQFDATILGGQTNVTVVYYNSNLNATNETNQITVSNITNGNTLFVRLSGIANCDTVGTITFNLTAAPVVSNSSPIICDSFNDQQEIYDLTINNATIVTNTAIHSFSYYNLEQDAIDNINAIIQPTTYLINVVPQTIYVRIVNNVTGCFSIALLNLDFTNPVLIQDTELSSCDDDFNLTEEFDLSDAIPSMLADTTGLQITYYSNEIAAQNTDATFLIANPNNHNTASETDIVFVRFDNPTTGCFSIGRVTLRVLKTPKLIDSAFMVCDTDLNGVYTEDLSNLNPLIIQDQTGLTFAYYASLIDAQDETNIILNTANYIIPSNNHTIYIRVLNNFGCWSIAFVNITFPPMVSTLSVSNIMEECDDDLDNFEIFNLTTFENQFTAEIGATFSYYNSFVDASLEANPIANPAAHQNITANGQTIFVRVSVIGKCDNFTQFTIATIHINPPTIPDNNFCAGSFVTLDAGVGYSSYLWSNGSITQTSDFMVAGTHTVTLTDANGCTGTYAIIVTETPLPITSGYSVEKCDDDGVFDYSNTFELTDYINNLTNNNPNVTTQFFVDQTSLDANVPITNTTFINTTNPQNLLVKVQDNTTLCYAIATLTLEVIIVTSNDVSLEVCDELDSEDGLNTFDLSTAIPDIIAGLPSGQTVTFYESDPDASTNANQITNLFYPNTNPYTQIIYARTENSLGCIDVSSVHLVVNDLPDIIMEEEVIYCLNSYPDTIDLSSGIINNPNDYDYLWNTGETTDTIQINEIGIYTVDIITRPQGCRKTKAIRVIASDIATIESVHIGNLAAINNIVVYVTGVGDYEYALDDINGLYQDSNTFFNVLSGIHTIYVRDKNGCGVVEETITSVVFPPFFTPNNDNYNDTWLPIGLSQTIHSNITIYIFDRYGKVLKKLNPFGDGWDGIYNGVLLPKNDYWFKITFTENFSHKKREIKSHFSLKKHL